MKAKGLGLICAAAMAIAASAGSCLAQPEQYPSDTLKFVCAFPAGSGADIIVRHFAEKIRPLAGRTVIVENRPGAGGMVALAYTAKSNPDGHTIFLAGGNAVAANMHLLKSASRREQGNRRRGHYQCDAVHARGGCAVSGAKRSRNLLPPPAPLQEKGNKASYAYSSPFAKVIAEMFKVKEGLSTVDVSYRSAADLLNDLASGAIDFGVYDPVVALAQANSGKLRILAISTPQRTRASAELPTFMEQGVAVDLPGWWAAMVPSGTPKATVLKINEWFHTVLDTKDTQEFLQRIGADPLITPTDAAQALFLKEIDAWREYVRLAKIDRNNARRGTLDAPRGVAATQSILTPLALIGAAHFSISLLRKSPRYCGVVRSSDTICAPSGASLSFTDGDFIACDRDRIHLLHDGVRCALRHEEGVPGVGFEVRRALFKRGRQVRQGRRARLVEDRERLDRAAIDLRLRRGDDLAQEVDLAGREVLHRRTRAAIGHVGDVGADHVVEQARSRDGSPSRRRPNRISSSSGWPWRRRRIP